MNPGRIRAIRCLCLFFLLMTGFALPVPAPAEDACSAVCPFGSAIVFRKFITGPVMTDSGKHPATEIKIHVRCPPGVTCTDGQQVMISAHWVCPGSQSFETEFICRETGFEFTVPINGTAVFDPDNTLISGSNFVRVPRPLCPRGYLIAYVVDDFRRPIAFDALIGGVILRASGSASSHLQGTAIPADPNWPPGQPLLLASDGALMFDGKSGHYFNQRGTSSLLTSRVRQNTLFASSLGPTPPGGFATAFITLLTLDVRSNRPNLPTFVPFEFFDQDGQRTGTSTEFVCWTERRLDAIDPSLTFEQMGTRWGLAVSGQAIKFPWAGIADKWGPVTLLGLIEIFEGAMPGTAVRSTIFPLSPVKPATETNFLP
jgi:hypothetical protein